jgi:cupin 2 domain-containing protein
MRLMPPTKNNLFADAFGSTDQEQIIPLLESKGVRIERIVSNGQASPDGFWYDQDRDEWVMLARGTARLRFEDGSGVEMVAGDCLTIEAHLKHRVEWVSADAVWLAVHLGV